MSFYHDVKEHLSPSALDNWHNSRSNFIRSYFVGEKTPETASMKAGKQSHALIEGGFLEAKHRFDVQEQTIVVESNGYRALGIPDSYALDGSRFVDYKTGKENSWDKLKLATDLKMKMTAWLVWNHCGKPKTVTGSIEWFETIWDDQNKEIKPTGRESEIIEHIYTSEVLETFTLFFLKTIADVNKEYDFWLKQTQECLAGSDVEAYATLTSQIEDLEKKRDEVKERIYGQMDFGGARNVATPLGSFYFTERSVWEYPEEIKKLDETAKIAKKTFEQENEPTKITKSLGFRSKIKK